MNLEQLIEYIIVVNLSPVVDFLLQQSFGEGLCDFFNPRQDQHLKSISALIIKLPISFIDRLIVMVAIYYKVLIILCFSMNK